jgi:hypothetical protein
MKVPSRAATRAISRPIPEEAPVTTIAGLNVPTPHVWTGTPCTGHTPRPLGPKSPTICFTTEYREEQFEKSVVFAQHISAKAKPKAARRAVLYCETIAVRQS